MAQKHTIRQAIKQLGQEMGPAALRRVQDLFHDEQRALIIRQPVYRNNLSYGNHERQKLDIYRSESSTDDSCLPVIVFVHGGGFLKGDKGDDSHWYNANVGRMVAQKGYLGVIMNYRLAPEFQWPCGGEDVAQVVHWLQENVAHFGGDPQNIILAGTSAGANHVATYYQLYHVTQNVKGLLLLSGLYGITELDERDMLYYGPASLYAQRMPLNALKKCSLPMFVACTEFDPLRFQQEWIGLMQARLSDQHQLDRGLLLSGHNHYSIAGHLGTSDTRLADEIFSFVNECIGS